MCHYLIGQRQVHLAPFGGAVRSDSIFISLRFQRHVPLENQSVPCGTLFFEKKFTIK